MRRFAGGLAALVVAVSASLAVAAEAWRRYDYPDLGFSIELPTQPERSSQTIPIRDGVAVTAQIFTVPTEGKTAMLVMVTDYSGLGISAATLADPAMQSKILESGVQGAVSESKSTLVSEKAIQVQGAPGREVVIRSNDGAVMGQFNIVLKGSLLYEVVGGGPVATGLPAAYERTWSSFRLTGN